MMIGEGGFGTPSPIPTTQNDTHHLVTSKMWQKNRISGISKPTHKRNLQPHITVLEHPTPILLSFVVVLEVLCYSSTFVHNRPAMDCFKVASL